VRANRDCDLLVVPNGSYAMDQNPYLNPYLTRRRLDNVVQHLLGLTPPTGFLLREPALLPPVLTGSQP
jgi:hypothetical protein